MEINDNLGELMLEQLKLLRGDVGQTNERLDQTNESLDQLRQHTARGFLDTNTKLAALTGEIRELTDRVDHFLGLFGQEVRSLRETVQDHKQRLSRLEGSENPRT